MGLEVSDNCQDYKNREIKYVNDFSETGSKKKIYIGRNLWRLYSPQKTQTKAKKINQPTKQTNKIPKWPQNNNKTKEKNTKQNNKQQKTPQTNKNITKKKQTQKTHLPPKLLMFHNKLKCG